MDNLVELLRQSSSAEPDGSVRMEAVQTLKTSHLTRWDVSALCAALETEEHPAVRAAAAQTIGFHRIPASFPEIAGLLLELSGRERDPGVVRSIAFALRGREEMGFLLDHARPEVREEAILGIPTSGAPLNTLLQYFFRCRDGSQKARIAGRLRGAGSSAIRETVEFVLTADLPDGAGMAADIESLIEYLPQEELFAMVSSEDEEITRTHREIWSGIRRRERKRLLLEAYRKIILEAPSAGLLALLLRRLRDEEAFHHRNVRFLRQVFAKVRRSDGATLLSEFRKLGDPARGPALSRLAEMLAIAARALPDRRAEIGALLQSWSQAAPEVGLRMYHLRLHAPRGVRP